MNTSVIVLHCDAKAVEVILKGLGKLPLEESFAVYDGIKKSVEKQAEQSLTLGMPATREVVEAETVGQDKS